MINSKNACFLLAFQGFENALQYPKNLPTIGMEGGQVIEITKNLSKSPLLEDAFRFLHRWASFEFQSSTLCTLLHSLSAQLA